MSLEMERAIILNGGFHSYHEGYVVLLEEVDELWDEVKAHEHDPNKIYKEAIQVIAMARELALCAMHDIKEE